MVRRTRACQKITGARFCMPLEAHIRHAAAIIRKAPRVMYATKLPGCGLDNAPPQAPEVLDFRCLLELGESGFKPGGRGDSVRFAALPLPACQPRVKLRKDVRAAQPQRLPSPGSAKAFRKFRREAQPYHAARDSRGGACSVTPDGFRKFHQQDLEVHE